MGKHCTGYCWGVTGRVYLLLRSLRNPVVSTLVSSPFFPIPTSSSHSFTLPRFLACFPCLWGFQGHIPKFEQECRPLGPNAVRLPLEASVVKKQVSCRGQSCSGAGRRAAVEVESSVLSPRWDKQSLHPEVVAGAAPSEQYHGVNWALFGALGLC